MAAATHDVSIPSESEAESAIQGWRGPQLTRLLHRLGVRSDHASFTRVAPRRSELLRILGLRPGLARAAVWQVQCEDAGVVPPGPPVPGLHLSSIVDPSAPLLFDESSQDVLEAGGTWSVVSGGGGPPPPPLSYGGSFGAILPSAASGTTLEAVIAQYNVLAAGVQQHSANAAQQQLAVHVQQQNLGLTDLQTVDAPLSERARHHATAYAMSANTHV